jgi:hypothetical protein
MPLHDWQFWVVTIAAAVGLWFAFRPLFPKRRGKPRRDGRPATGASTRATLTIEGKRVR